jgi:rRNA maturation endonuclease Nob1
LNDEIDACPRCGAATGEEPRYQCVRCFSVYCRHCADSRDGHFCPKCGVSQRIVLRAESARET